MIKYLGRVLPAHRPWIRPRPPRCWRTWLTGRRRSEFEPVTCLEAPEPSRGAGQFAARADGRSVYQRHGGIRYAMRAQLAMEERMVAHAGADGAPRVNRAQAAHALGADPARLDDALAGRAHDRARRAGRAHRQRAARGPGRRRAGRPGRRPARLGDQRAGRGREDPGAGRGRADLGRGRGWAR